MARSFLTPINLNVNELQNFVVGRLSTTSINALTGGALVGGRLQFDSTANVLKVYDGSAWQTLATGGSTFYIGTQQVSIGNTSGSVTALPGVTSVNGTTIPSSATLLTTTSTSSALTSVGTLTGLTMGGNIAMANNKITGLGTPTADTDAATKAYVDGVAQGLNVHDAVAYATTGALGTSGNLVGGTITTTYANGTNGQGATLTIATNANWTVVTIDGQTVNVSDRVLIKNQSSSLQNGIYTVTSIGAVGNQTSFVFTRATDNDTVPEIEQGDLVYVVAGTANGGQGWVETAIVTTVGTSAITWSQFSGSSTTLAGSGLVTNGTNPNQIDVNVDGTTLEIASDTVRIKDTAVTAASYGSASQVATFTVNAKGQLTLASNTSIGSLAASVITTGQLLPARGGTGADLSSVNQYGIPYFSTAGGVMASTAAGASTQVLIGNASGAPSWTNISGLSVSSATTATTATNATNVATTASTSASTFFPTFVASTTNGNQGIGNATNLTFVPSTGTLSATVFSGSGASLTSLPAGQLTGTVSSARGVTSGSSTGSFLAYNGTTAAAGQLDGGTTNPSGTTRLNYGGYLYATRFYGDGSNVTALNPTSLSTGTGAVTLQAAANSNVSVTSTGTGTSTITSASTTSVSSSGTGGISIASSNASGDIAIGRFDTAAHATYVYGGGSGNATSGTAGHLYLRGGSNDALTGTASGGSVYIDGGTKDGSTGAFGQVLIGTVIPGNISIGTATGSTASIGIGVAGTTTTVTGAVRLPTVGTSGFVKLGASGALSADTNTYLTSSTGVTTVNGSSGAITNVAKRASGSIALTANSQSANIAHSLGQSPVLIQVYDATTNGNLVDMDVLIVDTNNFKLTSTTSATYYWVAIGQD